MDEGLNGTVPKPNIFNEIAVSRSAATVAIGGVFSLTAGLASQVATAWIFGAGTDLDAFLTALVIPTYLAYALIFGLSFVLIPTFIEEEMKETELDAWALVGTFFWLTSCILVFIAIVGSLFSRTIIEITAPGLSPEKSDLSSRMLAILMFTVPFLGLGSLSESIQNARNRFFWPATARAFGSLSNVITLLFLIRVTGSLTLAWGNLIAAVVMALITVGPVLRHGWSKLMPLTDRRVLEILRLIIPLIFFNLVTQSTEVFQRFFASVLPDGDLSYIGYASRISSILVVVLAAGIAAAIFPAMARAYASNGEAGLVGQTEYGFRLTMATGFPAIAILGVIAIPMVTVLFERGAFDHYDTLSVSRIILIVLIGNVLFRMLGNVIARSFYVIKDTWTFPLVSTLTVSLYVVLGRGLANSWGYVGLTMAKPVQMGLLILITFLLLARKLRSINVSKLFLDMLFYFFASLVAALCAWMISQWLISLSPLLQLVIALTVAGPVYLSILYWRDKDMAVSVLEITGIPRIVMLAQNGISHFASNR